MIKLMENQDAISTMKGIVSKISSSLDFATAHADIKLFNLKAIHSKGTVIKILCAVLKSFCDSIKATKTMDAIDIVECAEILEEKYSHDSIKDIILALKKAKMKGMTFYNAIDSSIILLICTEYFDDKSKWLEGRHKETKSLGGDIRDETTTVQIAMEESMQKKEQQLKDYAEKMRIEKQQNLLMKQNAAIAQMTKGWPAEMKIVKE